MNRDDGAEAATRAAECRTDRKLKTFRHIQEEAIRLFLAKGYEATTVEEVAAASGVSHMTVYRYFPTKESLVFSDEFDAIIAGEIRQRPRDEPPIDSVEFAISATLARLPANQMDLFIARTRLIMATPALQHGLWVNAMKAHHMIADALIDRGGFEGNSFDLKVVAAIAAVISGVAALDWIQTPGATSLDQLVHEAFAATRRAFASTRQPESAQGPD